jgi:hypothetical protein
MFRKSTWMVALGAVVMTAGCLQKETAQVIYLGPDGAASWIVSEVNVRSDEQASGGRTLEEQGYIGSVLIGSHGVARALAALGPQEPVRTTVLREQRPFHVITEAHYPAIDRPLARLFTGLGIKTSATLAHTGYRRTLRVRLDFATPAPQPETGLSELSDALESVRFVLTEGRFEAAEGFDVADGTSATLSRDWLERADKASEAETAIEFVLTWTIE